MKNKRKKSKNKILSMLHYASVVMSIMSWYTTYNGFKNSVFANHGFTAGLASMAIQLVLLTGVLCLIPIINKLWKRRNVLMMRWATGYSLLMIGIVVFLFVVSMVTSITFSYISIVNSVYETDFAVNANIKLDGYMRKTVREMEIDNRNYLNDMRGQLIEELKESGEKIINDSAKERGKDYATTTGKVLELLQTKELISLDDMLGEIGVERLFETANLWDGKEMKYDYRFVKKSYVDKMYKDFMIQQEKEGNELKSKPFTTGLRNKINNLNRDKLAIFSEYHFQYRLAVQTYNKWIEQLINENKNENESEAPSLEEMRSLSDFCDTIISGLDKIKKAINEMEDGFAPKNTLRLIGEAKMNMDSLVLEADNIKNKTESMIKNTYGENSFSFEELITVFGSAETSSEDLNRARIQLLEMQGALLSKSTSSSTTIDDVKKLIQKIENYIDAVNYHKRLLSFKERISMSCNIVKDDVMLNDAVERVVSEEFEIRNADVETPLVETVSVSVIDVNEEEWNVVKKRQMIELDGLISSHPKFLYDSMGIREEDIKSMNDDKEDAKDEGVKVIKAEVIKAEESEKTYEDIYLNHSEEVEKYRKEFLDTSDMEKASNLLFGEKTLFPYKGKAVFSSGIAIFLDFGAFVIGVVMYFAKSSKKK